MPEETQVEAKNEGKELKKGGKKKFLIFLILGVLIIVLVSGAVFFLASSKSGGEKESKKGHSKEAIIYTMEPIVVNLLDPTGKRYLQIGLAFELRDKKLEEEIKSKEPKIKDIVINILSAKTPEEILQPEAKEAIKSELLQKINSSLGEGTVLEIYITQYIVE